MQPSSSLLKLMKLTFITVSLVMVLTACSSGNNSGGNKLKKTLVLNLAPQSIKNFSFTWNDVGDNTEYRLMENPDGHSGFTQIATIAANVESYDLSVFLPERINATYMLEACNDADECIDSAEIHVSGTLTDAIGYFKASHTGTGAQFSLSISLAADGKVMAVGTPGENSSATGIDGDQTDNTASNSGAVYVFTENAGTWTQQAFIKASDTTAGDQFGISVALDDDGSTLAVGANQDSRNPDALNSASGSGVAYVFTRSGDTWSEQALINAAPTAIGDNFGFSVSLSGNGDYLAVGAPGEESNATGINDDATNTAAPNSGAVYVFLRNAGLWSQQAYIKASNTDIGDEFGFDVALDAEGETLVAGAPFESSNATGTAAVIAQSNNDALDSGAAYVFTRSDTTWTQEAYIKASNTDAGHEFGRAVSMAGAGTTLAIGAPFENSSDTGIDGTGTDDLATKSGAAYVFTRDAGQWTQQAYIKASSINEEARFGLSLDLAADGNSLAVGAVRENSNATGINGQQADNTAPGSGAAYLFHRTGSTWNQQAYIKASNTSEGFGFGFSIALAAGDSILNTLAVGSPGEASNATGIGNDQGNDTASNSGAVYLY